MAEHRKRWQGTLVMVGQPSEESGGGAMALINDGLVTRFPRPTTPSRCMTMTRCRQGRLGIAFDRCRTP
jgi:hippurate hydrolase